MAVASKISDEELVAYASLVHEVCDKAQSLDAWFVHLDGIRRSLQEQLRAAGNAGGGGGDRSGSGDAMAFCQVAEQILLELLHCGAFGCLLVVVCMSVSGGSIGPINRRP